MSDLVPIHNSLLVEPPAGVEWSPYHLTVTDSEMPIERLMELTAASSRLADTMRYWIGDILLYTREQHGESAEQLTALAGVGLDQLNRYRLVCERVAPAQRQEWGERAEELALRLQWSHVHSLARLEDPGQRQEWFERLLAAQWSPSDLREALAEFKAVRDPIPGPKPLPTTAAETVDLARNLSTARDTLLALAGGLEYDTAAAAGIPKAVRALDEAGRSVGSVAGSDLGEPSLIEAVREVIASGVVQSGLADPAVIVPSGVWANLVAAHHRATEGRSK